MSNQDNLGRELGRALQDRADHVGGAPISFEAVKGTARGIRRRRAIAAGAGVAAAIGIVVPSVIAGTDLLGSSGGTDVPPASQAPSPTETTAIGQDGVLDASNLPTGDAPAMAWIDGRTLHDGGTTLTLPRAYQSVAEVGESRYVVVRNDEGNLTVDILDATGGVEGSYPLSGGGLATNADHTIVAWMSPDGGPVVVQDGVEEPLMLEEQVGRANHNAVAVVGDDCTSDPGTTEGGGCTVYFTSDNPDGGGRASFSSDSHGAVDLAGPRIQTLGAVSEDRRRVGVTEVHDDLTTCSELQDAEGTRLWSTCDYRGLAFSPDGTKLLANDSVGDGIGDGRLAVLDAADGQPLLDLASTLKTQAFVLDQTWEDDEHVLAVVYQQGRWSVVRFGLDGSKEYAVEPVAGEDVERPFFLAG